MIKPPIINTLPQLVANSMIYCFNLNKLFLYDLDMDKKFIIDIPPKSVFPIKNISTIIIR